MNRPISRSRLVFFKPREKQKKRGNQNRDKSGESKKGWRQRRSAWPARKRNKMKIYFLSARDSQMSENGRKIKKADGDVSCRSRCVRHRTSIGLGFWSILLRSKRRRSRIDDRMMQQHRIKTTSYLKVLRTTIAFLSKDKKRNRPDAADLPTCSHIHTLSRTHKNKSRYRDWKSCRSSSKNALLECLPSSYLASAKKYIPLLLHLFLLSLSLSFPLFHCSLC